MLIKLCLALCALSLIALGGCESGGNGADEPALDESFSFEDGISGWQVRAIDVEVSPGDEIDWSIEPSTERASAGDQSVKLYADNRTDACKIWLERSFDVPANTEYSVEISFDLAASDFGDFNLWTVIAGALPASPQLAEELPFRDEITTGPDDVGFQWLQKSYAGETQVGDDGKLHIVIGVWGTWETPRTYYLDNLQISAEPLNSLE